MLASHCRTHACGPDLRVEPLGDGCYVVDSRLYECTTDILPVGELACLDITPCAGACEKTITLDGREYEIDHCRPKWEAYLRAKHPLTCSPVPVQTIPEALLPPKLDVPIELMREVIRSGKDRLVYETEVCPSTAKIAVGKLIRSSGFLALDRWLRARLAGLGAPAALGACASVTLVLGRFECETEKSLL